MTATTTTIKRRTRRRTQVLPSYLLYAAVIAVAFLPRASALSVKQQPKQRADLFAPVRSYPNTATASKPPPASTTTTTNKMAVCEEQDFDLAVGKALDTLRKDYPYILTEAPDFSIYDRHLQVVDPSGVKVHGLQTYKNSFRLLHALVKFIYCPERSGLTFRMCYDKARQNIRVHWNAQVVPREIFGGSRTTLYVDGISVYEIDRKTGNITQHRIEHLLMNNAPVRPKEGVIEALRNEHTVTVPSFARNSIVKFTNPLGLGMKRYSSLFAMEATPDESSSKTTQQSSSSNVDWEALEKKNKSRKKFGLAPLTPEEFVELEAQVKRMESHQKQQQRAAASSASAAEMSSPKKEASKRVGFFEKLFDDALKDSCESNFDCERPEICCDFGFKKMCCASGTPVGANPWARPEPAMVPVPVENYPPGLGPSDDPYNYYNY